MHVLCPSFAAEYEIPTAQLTRPRLLRCTGCATEWRVPAVPEPVIEAPPLQGEAADAAGSGSDSEPGGIPLAPPGFVPGAISELPSSHPARGAGRGGWGIGGRRLWVVLWVMSLLVIAGALAAMWHWRVPIGHRWPPSMRLWQLLAGAGLR